MPSIGFGTYPMNDAEASEAVAVALTVGYRLIDTAAMYGNERGVGQAIARSEIDRGDVQVTSKLDNDAHGFDPTLRAFDASLQLLGLESLDLYLIHWPQPRLDRYVDSWRAMIRLRDEGRVGAIGVSNFNRAHIERLIDETGEAPQVNQIELHPDWTQPHLVDWHHQMGISVQAYCPLGRGGRAMTSPEVAAIAECHEVTPGQVLLRWHIQRGHIPLPKSSSPARIHANFDVFDFALSAAEMTTLAAFDGGFRICPDPDE